MRMTRDVRVWGEEIIWERALDSKGWWDNNMRDARFRKRIVCGSKEWQQLNISECC